MKEFATTAHFVGPNIVGSCYVLLVAVFKWSKQVPTIVGETLEMQCIMGQRPKSLWIRPWIQCVMCVRDSNIVGHLVQMQATLLGDALMIIIQNKC